MATIKNVFLKFGISASPDASTYNLYVEEAPTPVTDQSPVYDLGGDDDDDGEIRIDLATIPELSSVDSLYNLGITTVDDGGNESDMKVINDVPLDFLAPDAPGDPEIERI